MNKKANLIMIMLDGLRADKLNELNTLTKLSQTGIFCSNMITVAPYTIASIHAIFSGVYPRDNGVNGYFKMFKFKSDKYKVITEFLNKKGYYCAGDFATDYNIPKKHFHRLTIHDEWKDNLILKHKKIISEVAGKKPFFLFLHYSNIHTKLIENVKRKFGEFDAEFFKNKKANDERYNKFLADCNFYLSEILDHIRSLNLEDDTFLVIFNDHGTSLGEKKGEIMYGVYLYDYTLKAFCIIKGPQPSKYDVKHQVRTIDILPTTLDVLSINVPEYEQTFEGKSVIPFVFGKENEDRFAFSETGGLGGPWPSPRAHNVFSVRYKSHKVIYYKALDKWEFYDLKSDDFELYPSGEHNSEINKMLKSKLLDFMSGKATQ